MTREIPLQDAIDMAKQNPTGSFAKQMRSLIEEGKLDDAAFKQGVDLTPFGRPGGVSAFGAENVFEQPREEKTKIQRFADGFSNIFGGKFLSEGAGKALAAPGVRKMNQQQRESVFDQQQLIIDRIRDARSKGEDTSRLEQRLAEAQNLIRDVDRVDSDFVESLPSNRQVSGSALKLAGTAAASSLAGGVSAGKSFGLQSSSAPKLLSGIDTIFGAGKATKFVPGFLKGAATGATTGAAEGVVHGVGEALEENRRGADLADAAFRGSAIGAAAGGALGGVVGGVGAKIRGMSQARAERARLFSQPDISDDVFARTRNDIIHSEAVDLRRAIDLGEIPEEMVFSDPARGVLQPDFAQGRVDNVFLKLQQVDPTDELGNKFLAKIDGSETFDDIVKKGVETLDDAKRNSGFDARTALFQMDKNGTITSDDLAKKAFQQGLPEKDIALVKSLSGDDKKIVTKMLEFAEDASKKRNSRVRAIDAVGSSIEDPLKDLVKTNRQIGKNLDEVARGLSGQTVQFDNAVNAFGDNLERAGISVVDDPDTGRAVLNFKGSDFEGIKSAQTAITNVFDRVQDIGDDAFKGHKLKRFIDNTVQYGKTSDGLVGQAESLLKGFRKNIDDTLDFAFDDYNQVNVAYSQTRNAIDDVLKFTGNKFDLNRPDTKNQLAMLARRMFGNNSNRAGIDFALQNMQDVVNQYANTSYSHDFFDLVGAAEMLEDIFGTQATTGLQGQVQRAVEQASGGLANRLRGLPRDTVDAALQLGGAAIKATKSIDEENLIKALKQLLTR